VRTRLALPVYTRVPRDPDLAHRAISRPEVALHWFAKPGGESDTFNMFLELDRIRCRTLVIGGEDDPMHPTGSQADSTAALPPSHNAVRTVRGHGVVPDASERAIALLREFILKR
jgi:pimeloyl-ACP methyl ester carboxylesterase